MLCKYEKGQPIAYKIFKNVLVSNKLSHAYLIETNGYSEGLDLAISFAKSLLCLYGYTDLDKCNHCMQCNKIDDGNFTEIKIISPDGLWIKKEQLLTLQGEFSKKAIIGKRKVYIINGAECLNSSSANSILKFLEEPEENIIAILVTENSNHVMDTILSRCQIISLLPNKINAADKSTLYKIALEIENNESSINSFLEDERSKEKLEAIIKFIQYYENNGKDVLLFIKHLWFDLFNDKEKNIFAYNVLIYFYKDVLNYKCNKKIEIFTDYSDIIEKVADKNTTYKLCLKLGKIIKAHDKAYYNVNLNLIMDKLIIELEVQK